MDVISPDDLAREARGWVDDGARLSWDGERWSGSRDTYRLSRAGYLRQMVQA